MHVFCEIYNRVIPLKETEEEEIQLIKEINDIKKNKGLMYLSIKGDSVCAIVSGREMVINKCKNETFSILP